MFGQPFDQAHYDRVVHDCALELDFQILQNGDLSKVGINVSYYFLHIMPSLLQNLILYHDEDSIISTQVFDVDVDGLYRRLA